MGTRLTQRRLASADITGYYAEEAREAERNEALADPKRLRELHNLLKATQRHRVPGRGDGGRISPNFEERFAALEAAVKAAPAEEQQLSRSLPEERRSFWPQSARASLDDHRCAYPLFVSFLAALSPV